MKALRANLLLVGSTLLIGSILYPLAVFLVAQAAFSDKADGSIIRADGKAIGSRLIAQDFKGEEYFQPRPSSASYNAAASGASNYGANNPKLRDRVAQQLGTIVRYNSGPKMGKLVGEDIEAWFQKDLYRDKPGIVAQWAGLHSGSAQDWVNKDSLYKDYVTVWQNAHKAEVTKWMTEQNWAEKNPDSPDPKPADLATLFFADFSAAHPGAFPDIVESKTAGGETEKHVEPVTRGSSIQSVFFDMWLQDNKNVDLKQVPADLVTASGSGLDPDITLENALYQLDHVANRWAELTKGDAASLRKDIEPLVRERASAPLGNVSGPQLLNVLEINLLLRERYGPQIKSP
jgi:potassium-transporting ATPase KdpC subunit